MDRQEFSRCARLLLAADFRRVFKKPVKSTDRYFTVLARTNDLQRPRLGLAIAKKNVRKAVDRNRIKRLVRESFRINQQILPGLDIVVLAKYDTAARTNHQLLDSLEDHWQRLSK